MAYVDFLSTHPEQRVSRFMNNKDAFLRPSMLQPTHLPLPPTPICPQCYLPYNPLNPTHSFVGLCTNCAMKPSPLLPPRLSKTVAPRLPVAKSTPSLSSSESSNSSVTPPNLTSLNGDSFLMSNMLNVVDTILREDTLPLNGLQSDNTYCQNPLSLSHDHHILTPNSIHYNGTVSSPPPTPLPCEACLDDHGEAEYCEKHTGKKLLYFCKPCLALLCYNCIDEGHQLHPHTTIRETYQKLQPSIDSLSTKISSKFALLDIAAESAEKMRDSVARKKEEALSTVHQLFQSHHEAIIKREKEVIAQINFITDLRLDSLSKEREQIENALDTLKELSMQVVEAKDQGRIASAVLAHHRLTTKLDTCHIEHEGGGRPIEDDTYYIRSNTTNAQTALKSLCVFTTAPYPPLCTAMGEGLFHPRINRLTTVIVCTKDRAGEPCTEGGEHLTVKLRSVNIPGSPVPVDVRDNHNGTYSINFRPRIKGEHLLSIAIRDHHIQGSPFKLIADGGREYGRFGMVTQVFGSEGSNPGQFCRPWGICCDQKGNIIVGDRSNHRIQVFDPNGVFLHMFGSEGVRPGQFNRPAGVATTREGHIVVADKDNHRIQVLNLDGTFIFMFGSKGGNDGQMIYPYDVAVNQIDGRIAVTDTGNHRLLIFSHDGVLLGKFGYKGYLCGHFDSPRGIAFDDDGHIIVSDFNVHHILVIHPDGTTARILGSQGNGNGQFMRPQGIAVDHMGHFVVADTRNNRVLVMHPSGQFIAKLGTPGNGQGQFDRPTSVAVLPDGRIAVVDFGNSRIQIF